MSRTPVIVTFITETPPTNVKIGWESCSVKALAPRPRRCFKCLNFMTGPHKCTLNVPLCANCAQAGHNDKERQASYPQYAVCAGPHHTRHNSCPAWKHECFILKIAHDRGLNIEDARTAAAEEDNAGYSAAVKKNMPTTPLPPTQQPSNTHFTASRPKFPHLPTPKFGNHCA